MKNIYDKNGQYTKEGKDLLAELSKELDTIVEKYACEYNRIEFEHLVTHQITCKLALMSIKRQEWPKQK